MRNITSNPIQIVDLFSGPGGLGEGFSSFQRQNGKHAYKISVSIEKDIAAHKTLRLRAFLRQFKKFPPEYYDWIAGYSDNPDWEKLYPEEWSFAEKEAICAELGDPRTSAFLSKRISAIKEKKGRTLLIGGPPCQAYSLAGRSRNAGIAAYVPKDDTRHFLYKEYCRVLNELCPDVFVMENVKGILSSSVEGLAIFEQVMSDLEGAGPGYKLISLSGKSQLFDRPVPKDFIVRAEEYGVPQARHRVIIVGIRNDLNVKPSIQLCTQSPKVRVKDILDGLPILRSGLSKHDNEKDWHEAMISVIQTVRNASQNYSGGNSELFIKELKKVEKHLQSTKKAGRSKSVGRKISPNLQPELYSFLDDPDLIGVLGNDTRGHMPSDLARYLFAACFAAVEGISPRSHQFPDILAPNHKNWKTGKFNDRFRVQISNAPASTITSHISKDGHYFIHPDPLQCRSLTVREAARLQTFPDNYHFMGNRTEQFIQVGNAVPPFLAMQIAGTLLPIFDL